MTRPLLYSQAQERKERKADESQQGRWTATLWDQGDTMSPACLALTASGKSVPEGRAVLTGI